LEWLPKLSKTQSSTPVSFDEEFLQPNRIYLLGRRPIEMSYRSQSDEPPKINIELSIQISFPVTPLTNNDEYFSEKREESSFILNVLKEMGPLITNFGIVW
jgi:hypothetical protein